MEKLLKHYLDGIRKIAYRGKRFFQFLGIFSLGFVLTGCVKSLSSQAGMLLVPPIQTTPIPQTTEDLANTQINIDTNIPTDPPIINNTATIIPTIDATKYPPVLYYTQSGDTLKSISSRFSASPSEISSPENIPTDTYFPPNQLLVIPNRVLETGPSNPIFPDSEVIYSPSTVDFDTDKFVKKAGGYLSTYREYSSQGWNTGAQVVKRVAVENSINPRLLLSILEFQGNWVYGNPSSPDQIDYPLGWFDFKDRGLYRQLLWAVSQLSIGYYGWRDGSVTTLTFTDGTNLRLSPMLNAGSAAVQFLFSKLYGYPQWAGALYSLESLPALHEKMFGNPFMIAQSVEPLFPPTLTQPTLELPFLPGYTWALTGGPHAAWAPGGPFSALDFAPGSIASGCIETTKKVTAPAPGLVVRSGNGVVVLDLDGDGFEQTGWDLLFLHIATNERIPVGTFLNTNDPIGYPSCEGGISTGTHLHFARKYNGEWMFADGPVPFVLSGWRAHASPIEREGTLTKGDLTVTASSVSSYQSAITR